MDAQLLAVVIALVKEFYELTGSFPTPAQLQAQLDRKSVV